jgi:hypothetical protein
MPPYQANKSKAQQRLMFVLEREGKLRKGEARGKARASKGKRLPGHVSWRKRAR